MIANRRRRRALVVVALGIVALLTSAYASPKGEGGAGLASHSTNPRFNAISFSFDSPANGWALGLLPCAKATGCLALRETLDHGRSWSPRSLPAALVALSNKNTSGSGFERDGALSIFFADAENGWIYGLERGRPVFFSTHDGGTQWRQLSTSLEGPYGVIFDIAATRGTAYLVAQSRSYHGVWSAQRWGETTGVACELRRWNSPRAARRTAARSSFAEPRVGWWSATIAAFRAARG